MRLELLGILLSFILLTSGLGYDVNYAEAKGDDEPCSYKHPHSFLKISNDPLECKKVDYWVPEKCGIEAGLYKTDASCQPPPAPEAELTSVQSKPAEPESELPASSVSYIHTEPCSDTSPNSFLKISNDPLECKKVDYWVPENAALRQDFTRLPLFVNTILHQK